MGFFSSSKIPTRHAAQQDQMRRACQVARDILIRVAEQIHAGATTQEIDRFAASEMKSRGCKSAFLGYRGFPANICISLNEEVVHGIGGPRVIQDGDIVKIDVGVFFDGWVGDNALTVPVGNVSPDTLHLLAVTEESLHVAINHARHGELLANLCGSIDTHVSQFGYSVVREFVGHGVGRRLHEEPQIPNYRPDNERRRLQEGMIFAIEPMVNMGGAKTRVLSDGWTAITSDRKPSAHYEHVVLVTRGEPEILTIRDRMFSQGVDSLIRT
jgi:methionyl aminopeptidase